MAFGPGQRNLVGHSPWGHKRVRHNLAAKPTITTKHDINKC